MNVMHVKDVDCVVNWYTYGDKAYSLADVVAVDGDITAPIAFAVVANYATVYHSPSADTFAKAGWEAVVWKESCHAQKYSMQLYMKRFDKPAREKGNQNYFPSFSCSTWTHTFNKAKEFSKTFFPTKPHGFGTQDSKDNLKLVRLVRPIAKDALTYFKDDPMWKLCCKTKWHQYWAWGYPGVADNAKCEY